MAKLINNQIAQILALQETLARQTNRTSQNSFNFFVSTSNVLTLRFAFFAYKNESLKSFVRKQESLSKSLEFEEKSREFKS